MTKPRPLTREIMAIALPAIIANITTPLMGVMDVAITGHLGDAHYIAAIAIGGTLFSVLYWLMGFLRMGTSGLTAQAYGSSDYLRCESTLLRSLAVATVIGVSILILQRPIADIGLYFMDGDTATKQLARRYFTICIWGAPAVLATYSLTGWFLGMQNARIPMVVSIFINVVNVGISLLLTAQFHLKIVGVAIGTLSAQWLGLLLAVGLLRLNFSRRGVTLRSVITGDELRRFFRINRDIFFRTLCLVAVTLWFTRSGSRQGAEILAANTLLMQLFTLFSYFMDGFAYSGEALCGRYYGAGDTGQLNRCVNSLVQIGFIVAVIATATMIAVGPQGLALLTDDATVVTLATDYLPMAVAIPAVAFAAFIFDGVFIGLTRTHDMLMSMAIASALFFIAWHAMESRFGNYGLWSAFLLYLAARSLYLTLRHYSRRR